MPILIAVNPYKNLKIYSEETIKFYKDYFNRLRRNPNEVEPPVPHLYHLAEAAYQDMINEKKNQSLIISGESGSGKTQSTKIILKYLAVSSIGNKSLGDAPSVEKQVIDSNPLLEAFGNAKTVRNNNSSRFGKFIQVSFTEHGKILSARIYNYLLEKSRVVRIQPNERNYHIFYQLLLGANDNERHIYKIKPLDYFNYLNQGCFKVEDSDDAKDFIETKECMSKLGFSDKEMGMIFSILMGILYLGNVEFILGDNDNGPVAVVHPDCKEDFHHAANFLGIEPEVLNQICTTKKFNDVMSKKVILRNLSVDRAYNCRDAIAKVVYAKMFNLIILKVNKAISNSDETSKHDKVRIRKIGLLDIFGFENFENNSYEQLCINYANERLQQYFNNHIFKLEQEEYTKEGIDWSKVAFHDNKDIIDLIDNSQSIFSILDSQGLLANATDESFRREVYKHLSHYQSLGEEDADHISIYHYAGVVDYDVNGFIEKNLDQLTPDIAEALEKSKNKLIKKVFESAEKKKSNSNSTKKKIVGNKLQSDTLSKQFKQQLDELLQMLSQSNPRYVKCIKPNSKKEPLILDSVDVMEQLLSAGVLEAIKIRKQGYSIRRTQEEFVRRYHPLAPQIDIKFYEQSKEYKDGCIALMKLLEDSKEIKEIFNPELKLIQIGYSKVFMKEEVKNLLESKLSRIRYINLIQAKFRQLLVYRKVWKTLRSIRKIQAYWRGILFRIFSKVLKTVTIHLQKSVRFFIKKKVIYSNLTKLSKEYREQKEKEEKDRREKEKLERDHQLQKEKRLLKEESERQFGSENTLSIDEKITSATKKRKNLDADVFSYKESMGDTSILTVEPSTKKGTGNQNRNKSKNSLYDFLNTNLDSVVTDELKSQLKVLQEQLDITKKDKELLLEEVGHYKDQIRSRDKEIEDLRNMDKINTSIQMTKSLMESTPTCNHLEEINKLKKEISDNEANLDILQIQIDSITSSNKNIQEMNENLKDQLHKRKEKMDREMTQLFQTIKDLELKKNEVERENKILKSKANSQYEQDVINLQKNLTPNVNSKKIDEIKAKYEKEIDNLKTDLNTKEDKIKEGEALLAKLIRENEEKNREHTLIKKESDACKEKINELKIKLEHLHKNSKLNECEEEIGRIRHEFETMVKKKDSELTELKSTLENTLNAIEKLKKIEKALKFQSAEKDKEVNSLQGVIKELREENDRLLDDNILLKRENFDLKNKLEVLETECRDKGDKELKMKTKELKELKEKENRYEKLLLEMKTSLEKKKRVIESKRKMNMALVDLAKIKKCEVQCLEMLNMTNSETIRLRLNEIRQNEGILLKR